MCGGQCWLPPIGAHSGLSDAHWEQSGEGKVVEVNWMRGVVTFTIALKQERPVRSLTSCTF